MSDDTKLMLFAFSPGILYVLSLAGYAFWERFIGPRCPRCGRYRTFYCDYDPGEPYPGPMPRYFRCEACGALLSRVLAGPWQDASGPESSWYYRPWGQLYLRRTHVRYAAYEAARDGDYARASERLARAANEYPTDADLQYRVGLVLACLGDDKRASAALRRYVERSPNNPFEARRSQIVHAHLLRAEASPRDPAALYGLAKQLEELGDYVGAILVIRRYLQVAVEGGAPAQQRQDAQSILDRLLADPGAWG